MRGDLFQALLRWGLIPLAVIAVNVLVVYAMLRFAGKRQGPIPPGLVGKRGVALTPISRVMGKAEVEGHVLNAISDEKIAAGAPVAVVEVAGMVAKVAGTG